MYLNYMHPIRSNYYPAISITHFLFRHHSLERGGQARVWQYPLIGFGPMKFQASEYRRALHLKAPWGDEPDITSE